MSTLSLEIAGSGAVVARMVVKAKTTWKDVYAIAEAKAWTEETYAIELMHDHDTDNPIVKDATLVGLVPGVRIAAILRRTHASIPGLRCRLESEPSLMIKACRHHDTTPLTLCYLLAAKANVNHRYHGETALGVAVLKRRADFVEVLLDAKAEVDQPPCSWMLPCTALCLALRDPVRNTSIIHNLLCAKADPTIPDGHGYTPLHVAARYDAVDAARNLVQAKARVDARTMSGKTPLDVPLEPYNQTMIDYLESLN